MATQTLKRRSRQGPIRLLLCLLLLASLVLLSEATQNSTRFGNLYTWLVLINTVGLVLLTAVIGANLWLLARQYRRAQAGSRLTVRLVAMLVVLSVVPVSVVYYFSMQFLRAGVDSWFNVRIDQALDDALTLSQASLDLRMRDLLKRMQQAADELNYLPDAAAPMMLSELREQTGASDTALFGANGRVVAANSQDPSPLVPERPDDNLLLQLRQGNPYVGLDPIATGGLHIRILVPVQGPSGERHQRVLQALFPVSPRMAELAEGVQSAFGDYRELAFLREPLKRSFMLTLSLVLLLSLLFAVWTAFFLARRLVAPVRDLAEGTRALAAGDYGTQLPPPSGRDELGFLVQSFNDMSRRIAQAREANKRSQAQVEAQRAYLETVLSRLSSGVLTLGHDHHLRTFNQAAAEILGVSLTERLGEPLSALAGEAPHLAAFLATIEARRAERVEWREEFSLESPEGRRLVVVNGVPLPGGLSGGGHVLVIDDVTTLVQAQRDAAWGEVARRLAHEIKNPLTPIQLSAERIRHKYLERMEGKDAEVLERSTRTIVQQVEAMKEMVNAFSDYARPPKLHLRSLDVNALIHEVVELYRASPERLEFELALDPDLPPLWADAGRMRQLLHNLIKNAQEACPVDGRCQLEIRTHLAQGRHGPIAELSFTDSGPGFDEEILGHLFEPYVTNKPKGSGLGLAIVKKIVEEHNGGIAARNSERGAQINVRIPIKQPAGADALSATTEAK